MNNDNLVTTSMSDFLLGLPTHLPNSTNVKNLNLNTDDNVLLDIEKSKGDEEDEEQLQEGSSDKKDAICILGTNITLQTEEDIANWIEERKKKWPTRKNIELKKQEAVKRRSDLLPDVSKNENEREIKKPKNICRYYQQHKRCKFGNKCKNSHIIDSKSHSTQNTNTKLINNIEVSIPQRYKGGPKDSSLFLKLVKKDELEHENELVLDFILYLNEKQLIDHNLSI